MPTAGQSKAASAPVGRTKSVAVISMLGVVIGLIMSLGGLFLAEPAVFGTGTILAFLGLSLFVGVRFLAIAANQQIAAMQQLAKPRRPARPAPVARPATQAHLSGAVQWMQCPRCAHKQRVLTGAAPVCDECGLRGLTVSV